jgi:hypothetical protein
MSKYANVDHGEITYDETGAEVGMTEMCLESDSPRSQFERAGA